MHAAQLEHVQDNLQKEKEAALSELQTMLREKWAQESAMLQTRQQFELERLREQTREQKDQTQRQHRQEIGEECLTLYENLFSCSLHLYIFIVYVCKVDIFSLFRSFESGLGEETFGRDKLIRTVTS